MPDAMRAAAADGVFAEEGLPARNHVGALRIPGAKVAGGVRTTAGAVVILPGRLLASVGRYVILDTDFSAAGGPQELELAADGVHVRFDVASVLPGGTGSVDAHIRVPLAESVLSQLPARTCSVTLSHAVEALLDPWRGSYSAGGPRPAAG